MGTFLKKILNVGIGKLTLGVVLGALAVKFIAESMILFFECIMYSSHSLLECAIIAVLY